MVKSTVFVSGANGYIALHIIDLLLKGGYKVIGSVRSEEKAEKIKQQFQNHSDLSTVIVPDLSKEDAFDDVFDKIGCQLDVVLHTASPVAFESDDVENDLLIPAVKGTKSILTSIMNHAKSVKKVVVTSSMAAIANPADMANPEIRVSEKDWNTSTWEESQLNAMFAYFGSKKFAEKAVWDFIEENKPNVSFTVSTIMPAYVFGPQLFVEPGQTAYNMSAEMINKLIHTKEEKDLKRICGYFVDVRDVAKSHLVAIERESCANKRLLLCSEPFTYQKILDIVNSEFPELKGHTFVGNPGTSDEIFRRESCTIDSSYTKSLMDFDYYSLKESIVDCTAQILKAKVA